MADAAKQWDLERTESQRDEEFLRRRAKLRARYYAAKCSIYSAGREQPSASMLDRPHKAPANGESPRLPTTTWKRIRDAIGVVKGRPADAIEDTERLYDD